MTESTHAKIPVHLRKYIVDQNYGRYTPEDQAVWRYIMRQLKSFLSKHAHESYLSGLEKTGISVERIPSIDEIDEHLERFGWGAVPVSGFIPPAAFMEFQSLGILPIASDMRTLDHLTYTPAPDIVHEAAGHAPILVHPEYAEYLRQYGSVARHSIISKQDLDQYEAIRILSDIKEDPRSTREEILKAERRLNEINSAMPYVSEAALLSRMNWWTAEYGLIGSLQSPRIFGAGLLSSVGESRECLSSKVKHIPLSVECVNYSYDITEPQPQLFVAKDFQHLGEVLEDLAVRLAYRRGGCFGLDRAVEAQTVNTVQLDSGLQLSGQLMGYITDSQDQPAYLQFSGPSQLALEYAEIPGQGTRRHPQGYSTPVGPLMHHRRPLVQFTPADLEQMGVKRGERTRLHFASGVTVEGVLKDWLFKDGRLLLLTWTDCRVMKGDRLLFDPAWGEYDMAVGQSVTSVFGGPADRSRFGSTDDFVAKRVPDKVYTPELKRRHTFFEDLRRLRENPSGVRNPESKFNELLKSYMTQDAREWLPGIELLELTYILNLPNARASLLERLRPEHFSNPVVRQSVQDGVELAPQTI